MEKMEDGNKVFLCVCREIANSKPSDSRTAGQLVAFLCHGLTTFCGFLGRNMVTDLPAKRSVIRSYNAFDDEQQRPFAMAKQDVPLLSNRSNRLSSRLLVGWEAAPKLSYLPNNAPTLSVYRAFAPFSRNVFGPVEV